ncbi:VQ motif-containing protein 9-like isoform X2 [Primulina tabacum]|uniref:VQ motif-containing protein 9-like isoform X2 n=1 Tax=Primulina tabacum TaxID=48773 RepID=UPI003F5A68B0
MDKGFDSSTRNSEMYLKQVSKNSYKIAKPVRKPQPAVAASAVAAPILEHNTQQPPVYNINKNDFRDVVQKLTGSPSHERFPTPPPVSQPRPSSSRLQRIRPPPLAQIGNRPPQLTQVVPRPPNDTDQRAVGQLLPLPPLPSVHPAAESPISAYMRFIQGSSIPSAPSPLWNGVAAAGPRPDSLIPLNEVGQRGAHPQPLSQLHPIESPISTYMRFLQSSANTTPAALPRWNGVGPPLPHPPPPHTQQQTPPVQSSSSWPSPFPVLPLSPLPFGCVPSPRSPYAMLSPSLLFSPTGQLGLPPLPLSPTVPLPSPRWKEGYVSFSLRYQKGALALR